MKIKLLPFNEAKQKAKENRLTTDETHIYGISKDYWDSDNCKTVSEEKLLAYFVEADRFLYPKCCCEVVEE